MQWRREVNWRSEVVECDSYSGSGLGEARQGLDVYKWRFLLLVVEISIISFSSKAFVPFFSA